MLVVNSLISFTVSENEKVVERVLWLNKAHDYGYFFNIHTTSLPYERSISKVEEGLNKGSIILVEKDPFSRLMIAKIIKDINVLGFKKQVFVI